MLELKKKKTNTLLGQDKNTLGSSIIFDPQYLMTFNSGVIFKQNLSQKRGKKTQISKGQQKSKVCSRNH